LLTLSNAFADNEECIIFWLGSSVSPQLLKDLFDEEEILDISTYLVSYYKRLVMNVSDSLVSPNYLYLKRAYQSKSVIFWHIGNDSGDEL
jgi:hypothetical protein